MFHVILVFSSIFINQFRAKLSLHAHYNIIEVDGTNSVSQLGLVLIFFVTSTSSKFFIFCHFFS